MDSAQNFPSSVGGTEESSWQRGCWEEAGGEGRTLTEEPPSCKDGSLRCPWPGVVLSSFFLFFLKNVSVALGMGPGSVPALHVPGAEVGQDESQSGLHRHLRLFARSTT